MSARHTPKASVCPKCGLWVAIENHICKGDSPSYNERVASALERIATALEAIAQEMTKPGL